MSLLRKKGLGPLLGAEVVSSLGSQMTYLALPWFVLVTTHSAARMGVVLGVELLPTALLGIPSGAVVSKLGARRTMMVADAARAPLMASIPLLHSAGELSFPVLLGIVFVIGVFLAPHFSAQRLILPELVGDDERTVAQANAFVEGAQRTTALVGPSVAGVLIPIVGAPKMLYLDAATFLFSFVTLLLFVPYRPPLPAAEEGRGLLAGVRFIGRDPLMRRLLPTAVVLNALSQLLAISLPVLAFEEFGGSSRVAGVFFAAFGAGAVVGSLIAVKIVPKFEPIRLGACALVGLALPLPLLALHLPAWGVVAVLFVASLFGPLVNAPLIGVITMRTPEILRAKVMTAVLTFALIAGPLGLFLGGPLLQAIGPHKVFLIVAAGQLAAAIPFAFMALRNDSVLQPVPTSAPQ
jgi:MFS family permease